MACAYGERKRTVSFSSARELEPKCKGHKLLASTMLVSSPCLYVPRLCGNHQLVHKRKMPEWRRGKAMPASEHSCASATAWKRGTHK
eukprot:6626197-Alexandrium_andersonii.AAC.1